MKYPGCKSFERRNRATCETLPARYISASMHFYSHEKKPVWAVIIFLIAQILQLRRLTLDNCRSRLPSRGPISKKADTRRADWWRMHLVLRMPARSRAQRYIDSGKLMPGSSIHHDRVIILAVTLAIPVWEPLLQVEALSLFQRLTQFFRIDVELHASSLFLQKHGHPGIAAGPAPVQRFG